MPQGQSANGVSPEIEKLAAEFQKPQKPVLWSDHKNDTESKRSELLFNIGYPNKSPGSCYVACIGTTWKPGAWERVVNMVQYARSQDYNVWLEEIPDPLTTEPYRALDRMRNTAVMLAQARGFEWVCIVENDSLPEPELLVNLIERDIPLIAPQVFDPEKGREGATIGWPDWKPNSGLHPMRWVPMTFMLFRTTVFNCVPQLFIGMIAEGDVFLRLWNFGHRMYQDTDNPLRIASPPGYRQNSEEDRLAFMLKADRARRQKPDRAPVDPTTPSVAGMYAPWWTGN